MKREAGMRMSQLLSKTQRELPTHIETVSAQLLQRAGYVRQLGAGIFSLLPLGFQVIKRLELLIGEEMEYLGVQELSMPIVHPAEIWQMSGRWESVDQELLRFQDRQGRDYCLAMTHEEVVTQLAAQFISSYKHLPLAVFQFQTKFRDEPRPRAGLIRAREFTMKDAYSFHQSQDDFKAFYWKMYGAYEQIFRRCELEVIPVESDTGIMGGSAAHEFMYLTPIGEDTLILCKHCGYKANRQVAQFKKSCYSAEQKAIEEVYTPNITTIDDLAEFLHVPKEQTAKAVFMVANRAEQETLIFAVVRGDMEVNESKLARAAGAKSLRSANLAEIKAIGAEPGYASPIGIKRDRVLVIVDDAVAWSSNLVAGANRSDYHLLNTNYLRDYSADRVTDIAAAKQGDACIQCSSLLTEARGIEVGNIFDLGTEYSEAVGAHFLDKSGKKHAIYMGSYGIGIGRLLASIVEEHHDDKGICWPQEIAPYDLSLLVLKDKNSDEPDKAALHLFGRLAEAGFRVLFDDREENPGVKFKDADLLGMPYQIVLGMRGLEKGIIELKHRRTGEKEELSPDIALEKLQDLKP
ncbi:MAG: proline--tRNA ligase [Trueperaceae bacterium]|nr:proline--tRNA ligase [Trueperaceae bacterium]